MWFSFYTLNNPLIYPSPFSFQAEFRAEDRLAEEQKRHRELLARVEREAALQNENCQIKIKTIEIEANALREENQRLRVLCDKQANDLHRTEEKLELAKDQIAALQQDLDEALQKERKYEKEKKTSEELMLELSKELERLRAETGPAMPTTSPESIRLEELHQELEEMRQKNRGLLEIFQFKFEILLNCMVSYSFRRTK